MAAAAVGVRQASAGLDGADVFEGAGGGKGGREGGGGGGALLRTSSVAGPASFTLYHYNGLSTGKKSSVAGLSPLPCLLAYLEPLPESFCPLASPFLPP
jgi:hypothetical protein